MLILVSKWPQAVQRCPMKEFQFRVGNLSPCKGQSQASRGTHKVLQIGMLLDHIAHCQIHAGSDCVVPQS